MGWLRGKLTFSNVVACVALFVALGGASYAAFQLPRNSVGTRHLKQGAVTPKKLSPGTIAKLGEPMGKGFVSERNTESIPFEAREQQIATLGLPAGSFVFNAYAVALNEYPDTWTAECFIVIGNRTVARSEPVSLGPVGGSNRVLIAITGAGTLASPGNASLNCSALSPKGKWFEERITAVEVSSIGG